MTLAVHLQIVVGEDEAPENALKRFRWATKSSGLVTEVCADPSLGTGMVLSRCQTSMEASRVFHPPGRTSTVDSPAGETAEILREQAG